MRFILISTLIWALTIVSSYATETSNEQQFRSFLSGTSCGQMAAGLQNKQTQKEFVVMVGAFISGSNYAKGRDSRIDLKGMLLITEQFCRQNPKQTVTTALVSLDKAIDRRNMLEQKSQKSE